MKKILILLVLSGCVYTVKFQPLPVVLSWGGFTPDQPLVKGVMPHPDAGEQCKCP